MVALNKDNRLGLKNVQRNGVNYAILHVRYSNISCMCFKWIFMNLWLDSKPYNDKRNIVIFGEFSANHVHGSDLPFFNEFRFQPITIPFWLTSLTPEELYDSSKVSLVVMKDAAKYITRIR